MGDREVRRKNYGFTIVELIVVLSIVAIVAAMLSARWVTGPSVDAAVSNLVSNIRYTQNLAMTHGKRFRLTLSLPSSYAITTTSGTPVSEPASGQTTITLPTGTSISAVSNLPSNLIAFDGRGKPYTDSSATAALTTAATISISGGGVTRTITISPNTGQVSV